MIRLLLKKQLREIFRNYFYNRKKNKARSKAGTVLFFLAFALLMLGLLGGIFFALAMSLCEPLTSQGLGWMYYGILGLIALLLGAFGSVFNTYTGLYLAKDNDLLLSLPIPVPAILISRLLSVYLLGLMYSAVVSVPAVIAYCIVGHFSLAAVGGGILFVVLISLLVLVLSCLLGWIVAKISLKLKNKSFFTVLFSLLFIFAYYFFYFKAHDLLQNLIVNAASYGEKLKGTAYAIYRFGRMAEGDGLSMLIVSAFILGLVALCCWVLARSFVSIVTATGAVSKVQYREKTVRQKSPDRALLFREGKRFTSSANYMLNCGLFIIVLAAGGVALLWKGGMVIETLRTVFALREGSAEILLCAGICGMSTMIDIATPSVSLEGKNLWIAQSLPVSAWQILHAKYRLQVLLSGIPTLFCSLCALAVLKLGLLQSLLFALLPLTITAASSSWCLALGLARPDLHWVSEIAPIKQNISVLFCMLLSIVSTLAVGGLYLLAGWQIGLEAYLAIAAAFFALLTLLLQHRLKTWGSAAFQALS